MLDNNPAEVPRTVVRGPSPAALMHSVLGVSLEGIATRICLTFDLRPEIGEPSHAHLEVAGLKRKYPELGRYLVLECFDESIPPQPYTVDYDPIQQEGMIFAGGHSEAAVGPERGAENDDDK